MNMEVNRMEEAEDQVRWKLNVRERQIVLGIQGRQESWTLRVKIKMCVWFHK